MGLKLSFMAFRFLVMEFNSWKLCGGSMGTSLHTLGLESSLKGLCWLFFVMCWHMWKITTVMPFLKLGSLEKCCTIACKCVLLCWLHTWTLSKIAWNSFSKKNCCWSYSRSWWWCCSKSCQCRNCWKCFQFVRDSSCEWCYCLRDDS